MEKVSAGSPPRSSREGPAACTGAERSVTSAPTSKGTRIRLLVFVRRRGPIDWLNSLIIGSVLNLEFIVYFLSLHVGLEPRPAFCFVSNPCNCGPSACTDERAARQFTPQSSSVARVGLAEERTEEIPKRARVSQPACVNRQNSADTDPPRLRKYSWHKRCDRLSIFP